MKSVLIRDRKGERMEGDIGEKALSDRAAQSGRLCEDVGRDWSDVATS